VAVVVNEENWDMLPELIRKLKRGTSIIASVGDE
jgi:hypothetical protein